MLLLFNIIYNKLKLCDRDGKIRGMCHCDVTKGSVLDQIPNEAGAIFNYKI